MLDQPVDNLQDIEAPSKSAMDAQELRELQLALKLKNADLARLASVSERAVYYWRSGSDRIPPSLAVLLRVLAVRPDILPLAQALASNGASASGR